MLIVHGRKNEDIEKCFFRRNIFQYLGRLLSEEFFALKIQTGNFSGEYVGISSSRSVEQLMLCDGRKASGVSTKILAPQQ